MSAGAHTARPAITLKLATSLDGRIALANGESKWITGVEARLETHKLRAAHDAVIVGSETVLADDPELTARLDPMPGKQPLRIVADGHQAVGLAYQQIDHPPLHRVGVLIFVNQDVLKLIGV